MCMLEYTVPHFNATKRVSCYQNTLYVYCIQLIYTHTQKDTHRPIVSEVTLQVPHIPTDTLQPELDTL